MFIDKGKIVTVNASCGQPVPVRVEVNARARRLILKIDERQRQAVAVVPGPQLIGEALAFAAERADWLAERLQTLPVAVPFEDGVEIPLRGKPCRLSAQGAGRLPRFEAGDPSMLHLPGDPATLSARATRYFRRAAREDITEAVDRHCATLEVRASRISVKDTRSRWGSCTSDGRLSFSWRLVCAPPHILDYVAAHECAHLIEMNHSPRFWAQVERCVRDLKPARAWLRAHGPALHAIGTGT